MWVVKKINNNAAICKDNNNSELIAFGKGIGFPKTPYELSDLSKIERTYYGVNVQYFGLLNEIPEQIFEISAKIVDYARNKISHELNPSIVFTLADHINFAIERYKSKMEMKMPFSHDIRHLYEEEMGIGEWAVKLINSEMKIHLRKDEAGSIALHFINSENVEYRDEDPKDEKHIIEDLTEIVEKDFEIKIDRNGFNYSRFVSHIQYMLKRKEKGEVIVTDNRQMFETMKSELKQTYACALDFQDYMRKHLNWDPGEEELLYLMIHINRLCAREDCNL